jgi:3-oxoacyl-[acyl-carrier-protein] synthase-1
MNATTTTQHHLITAFVRITPGRIHLNGKRHFSSTTTHHFLAKAFKKTGAHYPRFHKMDPLSQLAFLASELLLPDLDRTKPHEDFGLTFLNRSASLAADRRYHHTIRNHETCYPSPADFIRTLPNIATGEIAIRNNLRGETQFHIAPTFPPDRLYTLINDMILHGNMNHVLAGWLEIDTDTSPDCFMIRCRATPPHDKEPPPPHGGIPLTSLNINKLYAKH